MASLHHDIRTSGLNRLRSLVDEQGANLAQLEELKRRTASRYTLEIESGNKFLKECSKCLQDMQEAVQSLIKMYKDGDEQACFVCKMPSENFFMEEDHFTKALGMYTKKQFFQGIGDMARTADEPQYDLLEVSNPESMLVKGQSEEMVRNECKQLERLQSMYFSSMQMSVDATAELAGVQAALSTAERQLKSLDAKNLDIPGKEQAKVTEKSVADLKASLRRVYSDELCPLLAELQQLQGSKILRGNYDLKIARQDYFLSKQNQFIAQLLLQCSRYNLLSMLFEVEKNSHQNSYHLLASLKSLLEDEVAAAERRVKMLSNPTVMSNWQSRETVDSRDKTVLRLYDAFCSTAEDETNLYKSFDSISEAVDAFMSSTRYKKDSEKSQRGAIVAQIKALEDDLTACCDLLEERVSRSDSENGAATADRLTRTLAAAEKDINNVVKDIADKRKLLESDSLTAMERSLFGNFFNDPARFKRTMRELKTRVEAAGHAP